MKTFTKIMIFIVVIIANGALMSYLSPPMTVNFLWSIVVGAGITLYLITL